MGYHFPLRKEPCLAQVFRGTPSTFPVSPKPEGNAVSSAESESFVESQDRDEAKPPLSPNSSHKTYPNQWIQFFLNQIKQLPIEPLKAGEAANQAVNHWLSGLRTIAESSPDLTSL